MRMCLFKINDWQVAFTNLNCWFKLSMKKQCYDQPSEGVELTPKPQFLSQSEIVRLAGLFVSWVTKIRLTGG
ncbi:hypothetical protein F2Q70_00026083 [Brassica cretica]|uniref:Uncharacterized protein n=1 Tax=Brassica cretica TaxID=69181 RepID=A0A8S9LFD3_BRACR|nr:hypothetical protein F2Q70_00026083 [Brassica cretica]